MTYTPDDSVKQALGKFSRYDVDTQLALLWYGYLDIKDELTPAPPQTADTLAHAYYNNIAALAPEKQLQAQRDILTGADNKFGRGYSALSPSARLEVWLLLGQGMENETIIQVPSDYQPPSEASEFSDLITQLSFEQRVEFMRQAVLGMGAKSTKATSM